MKSLLSFCILLALLQAGACPQEIKPGFAIPDSGSYLSEHEEQLFPFTGQKLSNIYLRKALVDNESGDPVYRPVEVVIDSSTRCLSLYDNKGSLMTEIEETVKNGSWIKAYRCSYTNDLKGNLLKKNLYIWSDGSWKDRSRQIYTYDINGNLRYDDWEFFYDTAWVKNSRYIYDYDGNARLVCTQYQRYLNNHWTDIYRISRTYSDSNSTLMQENFNYGTWVKIGRVTNNFDSTGSELSSLSERWQNNAWVKTYSSVYSYDSGGNRIAEIYESWQDGILTRRDRLINTYDDNGSCVSTLSELWQDSIFVKNSLTTRTYNETGSPLEILTQFTVDKNWANGYKVVYNYDNNGNAVNGKSFHWDGSAWKYASSGLEYYDFRYNRGRDLLSVAGGVVDIKYELLPEKEPIRVREFILFQNYPNPFNPSTSINYVLKSSGMTKLSVYDILGKLVAVVEDEYKPAGSYLVRFDGSHLPSGVYIYRLESGGYTTSKKFILMK